MKGGVTGEAGIKNGWGVRLIAERLFLIAVLVYLAFVHSRGFVPHDEGVLIQAGNRMMQGEVPYRDFQIVYNPGSIYANWLAFTVWGKSILATRVMAMINSVVTIAVLIFLGKKTKTDKLLTGAIILSYVVWGPGHINFGSPVMFCITFGLAAATYLWTGGLNPTRRRDWFGAGAASAAVFLFKQNFGLAVLIDIAAGILLVREYRSKTGIGWLAIGYAMVVVSQLAYLMVTHSAAAYVSDFFKLTVIKIGQEGIFDSPLPWTYPGTIGQKLFKIVLYLLPVIVSLWCGRIAWKKDRRLLLFSGLVVCFYLLSIRPTTDYIHLVPLLAITPVALVGAGKTKKFVLWGMGGFIVCGLYSSLFRQYYRWNVPLADQNYFNSMARVKLWMDAESRQTMKGVDEYLINKSRGLREVFVYSFSPVYYFVLDRQNPTRYDYLHSGVISGEVETEVTEKLKAEKTGFILADVDIEQDTTLIGSYIRDNYLPDKTYGNLTIWGRK